MSLRAAIAGCALLAGILLSQSSAAAAVAFLPGAAGFEARLYAEGGQPATQAGSHPVALTADFGFQKEGGGPFGEGDLRDLSLELPPGLIENPTALGSRAFAARPISTRRASRPGKEASPGRAARIAARSG